MASQTTGRADRIWRRCVMGIFDALNTAVGGLQAQSFALQNISGNIANASTTGYKGIETSFEDLIPDSTSPSRQVAGGVTAFAQATITTQGTVSVTTVATNMAINGDGFFSVQKATGTTDNLPVFNGVTDYTRRGDFQVNANGNLVNGAGYYLMGVGVDPKTGNPLGNVPQVLQFQNNFIPAQSTTSIKYAANLPSTPTTAVSSTAAAGTINALGGLNPFDFSVNPLPLGTPPAPVGDTITVDGTTLTFIAGAVSAGNNIGVGDTVGNLLAKIGTITGVTPTLTGGAITLHTGTAADLAITTGGTATATNALAALGFSGGAVTLARTPAGTAGVGTVIGNDLQTFLNESISGGAVTAYDSTGTAVNVQLRWAKTDSAALGGSHTNTWNLFYQSDPNATGSQTAWVNAGTNFTFGPTGVLTSPATPAITIPNVSVGNQSLGNLSFSMGAGTLTQFASTGGTVTINTITQNGFAAGQLQSVAINN